MGILELIFIGFEVYYGDSWLAVDRWNKHLIYIELCAKFEFDWLSLLAI